MSNLQFEYRNSISINSLVLLCIGYEKFDLHKKGILLSEYLIEVAPKLTKLDSDSLITIDISPDSNMSNLVKPSQTEHELMQKLCMIRDKIEQAIFKHEINTHEIDTDDCFEIRLVKESALKWCKQNTNQEYKNNYSSLIGPEKLESIYQTIHGLKLLYIEQLQIKAEPKKIIKLSFNALEKEILDILDRDNPKTRRSGTINRLLSDTNENFK